MPGNSIENHLFSSFSPQARNRLRKSMELVPLTSGEVLIEAGQAVTWVYFPLNALIALQQPVPGAAPVEVAVVGNDGVVGIGDAMAQGQAHTRAVVICSGLAASLPAPALQKEIETAEEVLQAGLLYGQQLSMQMSQIALCSRQHTLEQQICRWLLTALDRIPDGELLLAEDALPPLLDQSQKAVADALDELERLGIMHLYAGQLRVLRPEGLRQRVCGCHEAIRAASAPQSS